LLLDPANPQAARLKEVLLAVRSRVGAGRTAAAPAAIATPAAPPPPAPAPAPVMTAPADPAVVRTMLSQAYALFRQRRFDAAPTLLDAAAVKDPRSADVLGLRALVRLSSNHADLALADGEAAVTLAPDNARAYLARGSGLLAARQPDRALQ